MTSGLNAGYGATTTPQQATIGATLQLTTVVSNYGQRTWTPGAFALSYHIYDNFGSPVIWDGARGRIPSNVPPLTSVTVPISVALPSGTGTYRLEWDMVQEGVAWFSHLGVQRKREDFTIGRASRSMDLGSATALAYPVRRAGGPPAPSVSRSPASRSSRSTTPEQRCSS